jgi:protein-tyrosine phosphatase
MRLKRQCLIDLHCHLLPGIDDGAPDLATAKEMARLSVADGVRVVACTPHIFPGVYSNTGQDIRRRMAQLQAELGAADINCRLVSGSDAHVAPDLIDGLKSGRVLTLADSRYVLVEPPHHILPPNMDRLFFDLLTAGYVPILTHPERMSWADSNYDLLRRLVHSGVWMQLTAGSVVGRFGGRAKSRSERMLRNNMVHIVASDAHDAVKRPPLLNEAVPALRGLLGDEEAENLVNARPAAILEDRAPSAAPQLPTGKLDSHEEGEPFLRRVSRYFRP